MQDELHGSLGGKLLETRVLALWPRCVKQSRESRFTTGSCGPLPTSGIDPAHPIDSYL